MNSWRAPLIDNLDQKAGFRPKVAFILAALVLLNFAAPTMAQAEYRLYELRIENTETNKGRTTLSTLDHLQYPRYYPVSAGERVVYVDSWMCRENTSNFKKPCPKPDRAPSTLVRKQAN